MADIRLGGAYVDFFGRNVRFVNAARQNVQAVQRQQRAIRGLQTQIVGFNRTVDVFIRRFSLIAGIGFGLLVRDIAQLGQTMATVQAITGASVEEFALLTRQVEQLGRQTRFTTVQAAEGQVFLARAGFDVNSILLTLPGTLQLAQVGLIDVGRAADIATNIMLSFGAAADQTSRFVDVLANTSTSSNTNIVQLGDGLKLAGSLAGVLGLSIEQTAAAMGVLSNAGLQATIAGTGLRQIFADLTRLSGPAEEALAELGLTASDVAINQTQDLISAIETLTRAGATTADIFAIFDVRAATSFVVLQRYVESFRELEASNIAVSGVVASTSANILELGNALQLAGSFAREVEIDIEQAAAAFGILERAGIGATQANVGLRRLFTELTQLSGPAHEALRAVGLSAADVSILNSDLVTVLERLAQSGVDFGTVFSTQSAEIFSALLGIGAPLKALEEANIAVSGAVASTSANIIELGDALQLAGSFAREVEIDIEQAAAAFGILERAGIRATQANVGLRRLFTELTQLSGPAQEALRAVGLSAADVSILNSDLVTVLERLAQSGVDFGTVFSTQSAEIFRALQGNIGALKALEEANIAVSGAVASTSANIIELGDALQLAGSFAREVEIDIEQAAAAFGILERAGIRATQANVGLRRLFTELTQLSGPAQEALRAVGLSAADVSILNSDLVTVLERLARSGVDFGTIFSTQSAEIFSALQGSVGALKALEEANIAVSGAVASTSANIQGNIGALKALEAANRNAEGAAAGLARIQDDTLIGAFKRADSAFRGFFIRLDSLTGASTAAKNALDSIAQTVNGFTDNLARNLPRIEFALKTIFLYLLSSRVLLPVAQAIRNVTLQFGYMRAAVLGVTIATRALLRATGFLILIEAIQFAIDFVGEFQRRIDGLGVSIFTALGVAALRGVEFLLDGVARIPDAIQKTVRIIIATIYEGTFSPLGMLR